MAIPSRVMRQIAGHELDNLLPGLAPGIREQYITSIVRQWLTNDRWAGVFTAGTTYWLHLKELNGKILAGAEKHPSTLPHALETWGGRGQDLNAVAHRLTVGQSATFVTTARLTVRVSAFPAEHMLRFEEVTETAPTNQ